MVGVSRLFYFFLLYLFFVLSIAGLVIFSGSVILLLVFWDFLGISTFFWFYFMVMLFLGREL